MMLTKIIHNLVNTNQQNHHYYGKSPLCPSCKNAEETFSHVLPCQEQDALAIRSKAFSVLQVDLTTIKTPVKIIESITHGILEWE